MMNASRIITLIIAAALLVPAVPLHAQPEDSITLNFKDADIGEVIAVVSEVTGQNFIIDPRVRARVTVVSGRALSRDALYETFLSILAVHGFAAMPAGDVIRIVPDATARFSGADEIPEPFTRPADDIVTQVIRVENVPAVQLVPILRPLIPQSGHLAAFQPSNMLIISDRAGNVDRIVSIVRRIDQASDDEIEVIRLAHASAGDTVRILQSLTQSQTRGEGTVTPSLIADERTNSILLGGDRSLRLRLRALIAHLDTPIDIDDATQVVYLRYGDAENIATILSGYAEGLVQAAQSGAQSGGGTRADRVTILPDTSTNALVITAPPSTMRNLRSIIDQLDIRRAQVLVEAIIVESTSDRSAEFGIQWILDGRENGTGAGVINFGRGGAGIVDIGSAVESGELTTAPDGATFGVGRIREGSVSFGALLRALAADARTNILSTPHLLTMDNEEGHVNVGQQVPFLTGQFSGLGQRQGDGVVNPFQTINREDVGLILRITPKINEGDAVQMLINLEISSLTAAPTGAVDLVTNRREISTRVIAQDGDIIVLGGLMDDQLQENQERVPVLGSIPLLGRAFRYQRTSVAKRNLMVFLRPVILRDGVDANWHTNQKYRRMQELQEMLYNQPVPLIPDADRPLLPPLEDRERRPEP